MPTIDRPMPPAAVRPVIVALKAGNILYLFSFIHYCTKRILSARRNGQQGAPLILNFTIVWPPTMQMLMIVIANSL